MGAQADIAMLDPAYTMSLPMTQVISGAFDTLSHCMETYFGKPEENNLSDDMNEAIMRSVIRNMRVLLDDPQNYEARSELMWASAMGENSILKIGKITDFQAAHVWDIDSSGKSETEMALAGIDALAAFIKEMGLPTTFREMGITDTQCFQAVADSTNVTAGCCKKLSHEEIYQILMEAF